MSSSAIAIPLPVPSEALRRGHVKRTDKPPHPSAEVAKLADSMDELNQTPDRPSDDGDGLRQIKGIGQVIAQALNSLGIYRYADLASFTPDSLAALLKAGIPSISPKRIERDDLLGQARVLAQAHNQEERDDLLGQARVLAQAHNQEERDDLLGQARVLAQAHNQEELESPRPEADENGTSALSAEGREEDTAEAPREGWRELADFFISFGFAIDPEGEERLQTKAHYSQADKPAQWDGIVTDQLISWMLSQANLSLPTETEAQPVSVTPYDARIEILDVRLSQIGPSPGVPGKRLVADIRFQISGPEAENLTTERIPFRIEVHAVNLESGALTLVASERSQLQPRVFEYTSQQSFPMPDLGLYELHTILLVLPPGEMMVFRREPTFRVVP